MDYAGFLGKMSIEEEFKGDGPTVRSVRIMDFSMVCLLQKGISSVVLWFSKLSVFMASSSESIALVEPPPLFKTELREIPRKLRGKKRDLQHLDEEGGRRLELVDRYLTQIREEFAESLSQSEWEMMTMLGKLEICFEKLELQV